MQLRSIGSKSRECLLLNLLIGEGKSDRTMKKARLIRSKFLLALQGEL